MELLPPYSASLGAMGSLAGKLDALLDAKFKDEIGRLGIRLLKLSKARDPPLTARCWMKDVRQLSCELESCIATETDWIDRISGVFRARVKEANRRYNRYMLKSVPSCRDAFPIIDHRLATVAGGPKIDPVVVGLHDEGSVFDRLCPLLTDGDEQLKVLSIVGVGGIGKTTLAKQLWRMHKVGDYFSCRAFVRTAKKPDMRRILRSILAQVRPHQPPDASEVHDLIHDLTEYLRDKRYLIIIDDLWASSVWDVARRAFPEGNCGSRIITTTETGDVALACCSYQSRCIFEMIPLSISQSKELFNTVVFGTGEEKSHQLDEVSDEIIRRCAGLPQAIITISGVLGRQWEAYTVQNREMIQNSLPTNATYAEILKQVLNCCYNCLPSCLQTCLLYLSLYPENYLILKEDIMKQWVVEGFIPESTEKDSIKVAGIYFDMLVNMGMIQHIDVDYSDEVLYYVVHHMVHDFITSKSIEENFITVMDYSQRTIQLSNKVSRLSLQFGSATHATLPASTGLSQVRSLAFFGLMRCLPSIFEFKLLRSLILHIWVDQPSTGLDLKPTSELVLLRSFQVTCNDTVHLPDLMQGLKHLETLEINARVAPIPANIFHLRNWLHLRVGRGTELPHVTGFLTNVNLNHPVTLDEFSNPPNSVKTVELFPSICKIPKWIEQLTKLSILNIVVRELQRGDIHNLQRLPLTFLSLYVQRRTREQISFAKDAFSALEYFEFRCGVLRLTFEEGAMPNLQRLKLGFNARGGHQHDSLLDGIAHLSKVQEIFGIIGSVPGTEESHWLAAESAFKDDSGKHANNVSIKRVHMVEEEYGLPEKQHLIRDKDESSKQLGIPKPKYLEDATKDAHRNSESIQRRSNNKEHASVAPRNEPGSSTEEFNLQKIVIRLDIINEKSQSKAMIIVATFPGVESISVDREKNMLTLLARGVDLPRIMAKLRMACLVPELISYDDDYDDDDDDDDIESEVEEEDAAEDAAAPESWETADLDGAMSRLLLSSNTTSTARRVASSPDLADDDDQPALTAAQEQRRDPAGADDDLVAQVDQFLREALEKPRERLSVLRMEQEILKFIHDPRQTQYEFQGLPTSYLCLAAHRVAQYYFLQSITLPDTSLPDGASSRTILRKTSIECRLPAIRLADIPVYLPQEENSTVAKVAIKQRPQKNYHGGAGAGANSSRGNLQKSVEERKEEYNKARARIFSSSSGGSNLSDGRPVDEVILPNTLRRPSSLELNPNTRYSEVSEATLERSLTSTSSSSRANRSRIDKEPPVNRGGRQGNKVAIFRDRDSDRKDPDYDRSYDRYMQRFDPGFGFNGGAYTIQPMYAPAVTYNTEFPQLGSPQMSPVPVEQQPHPMAQHMPGPWSPAQSPNAVGYRPQGGVMPQLGSSVFMHTPQQYAMPSRPGVTFVHPQDSMRPFAQVNLQKIVIRLDIINEKSQSKAMSIVATFPGVEFIRLDREKNTLTLLARGVDPTHITARLRKACLAPELISVRFVFEPEVEEKKPEAESNKPDETKKPEDESFMALQNRSQYMALLNAETLPWGL